MTDLPPPPPPRSGPGPHSPEPFRREEAAPPKWSVAAVAAFCCSILGCLGVTAVAGLILGVVGIVRTADGKRRGLGLAIAAIPISLVMGVVGIIVLATGVSFYALKGVTTQAESILRGDVNAGVSVVRKLASDDLNQSLSDEEILTWIRTVRQRHGTLTGLTRPQPGQAKPEGATVFSVEGRFVNGPANITVAFNFMMGTGKLIAVEDLAVDGYSLREVAGEQPVNRPPPVPDPAGDPANPTTPDAQP